MELKFKQWLELFGQAFEPPVEEPTKISANALPHYVLPPDNDLPPTPQRRQKKMKKGK